MSTEVLGIVSDRDLITRTESLCAEGNRLLARLLEHLIEIEERRLHLEAACSSLFDFCRRRLGMSEGAAFRRITAARLVRKFPRLLARIGSGEIHLSSLVLLRDHLTEENLEELIEAASRRSKRQVQELVARIAPRPDVKATLRRLPATRPRASAMELHAAPRQALSASSSPAPRGSCASVPECAGSPSSTARSSSHSAAAHAPEVGPPQPSGVGASSPRSEGVEPLSEARHRLQLTISSVSREKLERARDLMRHRNPSGDLEVVIDHALDALLETLEKERLGKTTRATGEPPRVAPRATTRVTRSTRREVFARDGERCTFVSENGERCSSSAFLELDHIESRALGGSNAAANVRVLCRSHNMLHAEKVFGRELVRVRTHFRQRKGAGRLASLDVVPSRRDTPSETARPKAADTS